MDQGDGVSGSLDRLEDENDRLQGNDKWFGSGCFLLRGMCREYFYSIAEEID